MKCEICGNKIQEIFLKKIVGTTIKDDKKKLRYVCNECQKKFNSKEKLLKNLK